MKLYLSPALRLFPVITAWVSLMLLPDITRAQDKVWSGYTTARQKVQQKTRQQKERIKARGRQLRDWGTSDTYHHALYIGGQLHTNGWSGNVSWYGHRSAQSIDFIRLHCSEIRHEKEIRQQRKDESYRDLAPYKPYIFGKQYKDYTIQLGIGREQILFPALLQGNISLKISIEAGVSIALLKPVYLHLLHYDGQEAYALSEKYGPDNADLFLTQSRILGADRWSKGLNELKAIPGLYASPAIILEPDRPRAFVQQIVLGARIALYTQRIPILLDNPARSWQASCFVGIHLGKRW